MAIVNSLREQGGPPIFLNADHTYSLPAALEAAKALGHAEETKEIIRIWVAAERPDGFVRQVLGRELGLS